jgi:hypothetical protein
MNWHHIITVYLKELRDSLRDRRTLISMIVILMAMLASQRKFKGWLATNSIDLNHSVCLSHAT